MNRFNLTFSGEIVEGQSLELVKQRFANKFAIDDPVRLERFFSGETVILRRNLERKAAAQVYHELQLLGVVAALVKITTADVAEESIPQPPPKKTFAHDNATRPAASATADAPAAKAWPGDRVDIAAEIKARKLAAQRLASEKAAQEKAALEARQREIAEAAAREQALAAERQRLVEEERARQAAEQARLASEEIARKAAEEALIKRLEAEETARKNALKAAAKRKAAEEAVQRKAKRHREKAEKARRGAEEAARRQVELEEKKRLAAEEAARHQAELEEKKRLAAEQEARRKAALEEQKRLAAAEAARLAAAEAAEDARLKAELEAIKRREAEEAARLQKEVQEKSRQNAALAARNKAEAQRLQEEAQRQSVERQRIAAEELAAQEKPVFIARAAKSAKARVKTALDVPLRTRGETPQIGTPGQRKRQSGEPNLYKLQPFRNSAAVRARALQAGQNMRKAYTLGAIALTILLIAGGNYLRRADDIAITGATAMAVNAKSEPLLLAGNLLLLHDRAGVSTTTVPLDALGVSVLEPPLVFDSKDALLARGRLREPGAESAATDKLQLLRCELTLSSCAPFSPHLKDITVDAFVINPLDDSLLIADRSAGQLLKINRDGAIVASAAIAVPARPILRLHGGLLLVNSAAGPAISVFRYEDDAFGQQLDEILLLPPNIQTLEEARVRDFLWSGDAWWVSLRGPGSSANELHRFDEEWNYLNTVPLASVAGALQLVNWGQKTLINNPGHPAIQRYNAAGRLEAPFASTQLQELGSKAQQRTRLVDGSWHGGLLLCALAALLGFGFGYWQGLRNLVYRPRREQGAEPLDNYADALHWMEPVQSRQAQLRRTGVYYGLGVFAVLLLAIALNISVEQMTALLIVLSGPAIALLLLSRQAVGYIGVLGERLVLVNHSGLYHLAGGSRLQYCGPFLAIDDIVVFCGSRWLPAFPPALLQRHIRPLALGGVKVDRKTIAIKLLECRHPLALGVIAMAGAATTAVLLLFLATAF